MIFISETKMNIWGLPPHVILDVNVCDNLCVKFIYEKGYFTFISVEIWKSINAWKNHYLIRSCIVKLDILIGLLLLIDWIWFVTSTMNNLCKCVTTYPIWRLFLPSLYLWSCMYLQWDCEILTLFCSNNMIPHVFTCYVSPVHNNSAPMSVMKT